MARFFRVLSGNKFRKGNISRRLEPTIENRIKMIPIQREVSVTTEDIDDKDGANVFGDFLDDTKDEIKTDDKEFQEENLLVNPDLLKEVKLLL